MPTDGRPADISAAQARRIALGAQGLLDPRPTGRIDARHLARVFRRVGMVQIDSVNVLVRSQELPLLARLGPHPRSLIPEATAQGRIFEYWAHMAAHLPVEHHRLMRWRMEAARRGDLYSGLARLQTERPEFVRSILERVRADGPVVAGALSTRTGPKGQWWDWDDAKAALELLFWTGDLTATRRANDFARVYDLPERVLPPTALGAPTPDEDAARRELLVLAGASLGVATLSDLADYHRQSRTVAAARLREVVEAGELIPVRVHGWTQPAYLHPAAALPRVARARALLSPFDSLIWFRERLERVFGVHYRIEIYTPAPQRRFGYYVLPFLLGDRIVARVDLKSDRAGSALLARAAHTEEGEAAAVVAPALASELRAMAAWLGLERVLVEPSGDLAPALAAAVAQA